MLINANGSITSGLVNVDVARRAIYIAYLTYVLSAASLVLSVYNLMFSGNIIQSIMAPLVLIIAVIVIAIITQKFKKIGNETRNYHRKAKSSLLIIEGLLKNRREVLERCLGLCSGKLCDDIRELTKYYREERHSACC